MKVIHAYGIKDGKETLIFQNVVYSAASVYNMRQAMQRGGYELSRAYISADHSNGYKPIEITSELKERMAAL